MTHMRYQRMADKPNDEFTEVIDYKPYWITIVVLLVLFFLLTVRKQSRRKARHRKRIIRCKYEDDEN